MIDPFFQRAVVLVWHHDEEGAIGVVVNKELDQQLTDVLASEVAAGATAEVRVGWGGPVEPGSGTVVTRLPVPDDEGWNLEGDLSVTRSMDALVRLLGTRERLMLCLGYAGWGPGQLDDELQRGSWLWTECDAALVFDVAAADRYDRALGTLGLTSSVVWMPPVDE
jgi:putative transcriptional regulator